MDWTHPIQNSDKWQAFVNTVLHSRDLQNSQIFCKTYGNTRFQKGAFLHEIS
jgi:hypothetical protein